MNRIRSIFITMLLLSMMFSAGMSAYAIDQGETISYRGSHFSGGASYADATYDGVSYKGTCAELGVPIASQGTGTISSKYQNNSKIAKVIYHFVYEEGWFEAPKCNESIAGYLPVTSSTSWTFGKLVEAASQINAMGEAAWLAEWGGASDTAITVAEWYRNLDVSGVSVPDDFALYYVDAGSSQNFVLWALEPQSGFLKLKKISANTGITG